MSIGPGEVFDLGAQLSDYYSGAADINDRGQIVGYFYNVATSTARAYLWQNGAIMDLGAQLINGFTYPQAINARGQIAGQWNDGSGMPHAVLWTR